jgi:hypothetical protein
MPSTATTNSFSGNIPATVTGTRTKGTGTAILEWGFYINGIKIVKGTTNSSGTYSHSFSQTQCTTANARAYCIWIKSDYTGPATYAYGSYLYNNYPTNPQVTTTAISSISLTGATCGGEVVSECFYSVTARGICWNTSTNPTTANQHTHNGTGLGTYTSYLTGLTSNTTYYVRAYATNNLGTSYGANVVFDTLKLATLTTTAPSSITYSGCTAGGNITDQGSSPVIDKGVCWSTSALPTIVNSHTHDGSGIGAFTSTITGLTQGNTYYIRAYATNTEGTSYGNQQTVTAVIIAPVLVGGTDVHLFPNLGWSGSTQVTTWTGATSQRWYHKLGSDVNYTLIATLGKSTGNTYQYYNLLPNVDYNFYCTYYKVGQESPASNVVVINNTVSAPIATYSSILKV